MNLAKYNCFCFKMVGSQRKVGEISCNWEKEAIEWQTCIKSDGN